MIEIIPGILEKEWSEIEKKIELIKPFSKWAQIDLLDGKFAESSTFLDPEPFSKYKDSLFLELHMMVEDPEQYIEPFAKVGFRRFIGHIEKMPDQASFVARAQLWGEVGLAIDIDTPIEKIEVSFEDLDFLTVMTVKAGFSGQEFQKEMLKKCLALSEKTSLPLEIDGGIREGIIHEAKAAGVTRVVATSFLFDGDPKKQYGLLNSVIAETQTS